MPGSSGINCHHRTLSASSRHRPHEEIMLLPAATLGDSKQTMNNFGSGERLLSAEGSVAVLCIGVVNGCVALGGAVRSGGRQAV